MWWKVLESPSSRQRRADKDERRDVPWRSETSQAQKPRRSQSASRAKMCG